MKQPSVKPPVLADRLFKWYCSRAAVEDLHGDMEELFYKNLQRMPSYQANIRYWQQVLSLVFSYAIKKRKQQASFHTFSTTSFNPAMLKNYFLIATRNLAKHKIFTAINVFGLAVGMSISLLLIAMLSFIFTYDNFHTNKDRIYRIISQTDDKQSNREFASAPEGLAEKLKEYSGIEKVVRINRSLRGEATLEGKEIPLNGYFVDPEFLQVFTFPLLKGNNVSVLSRPNTLIITEKAAKKFFGDAEPVGKVIQIGEFGDFEVTGILKDHPKNSHMQFEVLASYQTFTAFKKSRPNEESVSWREFRGSYIYLLLPEIRETSAIENYLNGFAKEIYAEEENFSARFELQALNDIAPGPPLYNQIGPAWDYTSFGIFIVLTLMILLPACFNYASISISRALKRMKEIGLRKVMGGQRNQIFFQFIMETVIVTFIALILSYYIFVLVRAEFMSMLVESEALDLTPQASTIIYFILFALFVGFASGFVPALYFSKLNPIQALKTKPAGRGLSGLTFRKVLIVSQFALSIGFIMSVVIVLSQYRYAMNFNFGFRQENILDVELQGTDQRIFRNEFEKLSSVQTISMSSHVVGTESADREWIKNTSNTDSIEAFKISIDEHYLSNLNLSLLAGKNFGEDIAVNKKYIIVNETFLQNFKINPAADALDYAFVLPSGKEVSILGVVKNFHYMSLREPIRSFFFSYDPDKFQYANIKIMSNDMYHDLSEMESTWKAIGEENKFQAQFFEDEIKDTYDFYFSMIKICGFLGLLAITISCLGLLGMVVFTVENRIKEVGVRKVMGASTTDITLLLSKDYVRLLMIAAILAVPITYFLFDNFFIQVLQYYSRDIGVLEIVISLGIVLVLGTVTVMSQTIKAARSNPIDTLRYE